MAKGGGGGISGETILAVGLVLGGGYLLFTGQMDEVISRVKEALDSVAGRLPLPSGGGGASYGGGGGKGCAGTTQSFGKGSKEMHDDPRVEWDVPSQWAGLEATAYITVKNPKKNDEVSFKLWGPSHSSDCCSWYIVGFGFDGKVRLRYEQPHPDTHDCGNIGSLGQSVINKSIGYRVVILPLPGGGAHLEAWADTGGGFRKVGEGNNPCGKKFGVQKGARVGIRIDNAWDSTMQCGGIRQLGSGALLQSKMVHEINESEGMLTKPCVA